MEINSLGRVNEFVIRALLEHECQFKIVFTTGEVVDISFSEGSWTITRKDKDFFTFYDALEVTECKNRLLYGFLRQRISTIARDNTVRDDFRGAPAKIIVDAIFFWAEALDKVREIKVVKDCR